MDQISRHKIEELKKSVSTGDSLHGEVSRYLSFSLQGEEYALPLLRVKEVIALPDLTPVPQTPAYFLGIMNLRGQIISVVDLRLKLQLKAERHDDTCVIICDLEPITLGVVVNSVNHVLALASSQIGERPEVNGKIGTEFILGVAKMDKKMIVIIDILAALGVEDNQAGFRAIQERAAA